MTNNDHDLRKLMLGLDLAFEQMEQAISLREELVAMPIDTYNSINGKLISISVNRIIQKSPTITSSVAIESLNQDRNIAIESLSSFIEDVFKAIVHAIEKILDFITDRLKLDNIKKAKETIKKMASKGFSGKKTGAVVSSGFLTQFAECKKDGIVDFNYLLELIKIYEKEIKGLSSINEFTAKTAEMITDVININNVNELYNGVNLNSINEKENDVVKHLNSIFHKNYNQHYPFDAGIEKDLSNPAHERFFKDFSNTECLYILGNFVSNTTYFYYLDKESECLKVAKVTDCYEHEDIPDMEPPEYEEFLKLLNLVLKINDEYQKSYSESLKLTTKSFEALRDHLNRSVKYLKNVKNSDSDKLDEKDKPMTRLVKSIRKTCTAAIGLLTMNNSVDASINSSIIKICQIGSQLEKCYE